MFDCRHLIHKIIQKCKCGCVNFFFTDETDATCIYSNLASGAESGWDFSSRWLKSDSLSSIRTLGILPAELNAIICQNEATLSKFYRIVGE